MTQVLIVSGSALTGLGMLCWTALRAWRGWLDYQRHNLAAQRSGSEAADPEPGLRIEMAAMRERLRKLEAIAQGVDL